MSRLQSRFAMLLAAAVAVVLVAPNIKSVPNSPPVGVDDNFEVAEGTQLVVDAPGLLGNDFDPDGDPIASGFHSDPDGGSILAMTPDGAFIYEPDPGVVGVDSFAYAVRDDLGSSTGRVVSATINVIPAPARITAGTDHNDPPVGVGDAVEVAEDATRDVAAFGMVADDSSPDAAMPPVTGTTSNVLIPGALLGVGFLVIAFGVRRARNGADERYACSKRADDPQPRAGPESRRGWTRVAVLALSAATAVVLMVGALI